MTLQETATIMDILTAAYPHFYGGKRAPDEKNTLSLWASVFADDDVRLVAAAVKALQVLLKTPKASRRLTKASFA